MEYRTKSGRVLTDADIEVLADEAARGYELYETDERVADDVEPALRTRFRWRAVRRARTMNARRLAPTYRWEAVPYLGHGKGKIKSKSWARWEVAAFQNVLRPSA